MDEQYALPELFSLKEQNLGLIRMYGMFYPSRNNPEPSLSQVPMFNPSMSVQEMERPSAPSSGSKKILCVVNQASERGGKVVEVSLGATYSNPAQGRNLESSSIIPLSLQVQLFSCLLGKQDDTVEKKVFLNLAGRVVLSKMLSFKTWDLSAVEGNIRAISQFCTDVQNATITFSSLILPQSRLPLTERAQRAACGHLLQLMKAGFDETQISSVDQLKRLMTVDLDPTWPEFMDEARRAFTSRGPVSDCKAMFMRHSLKILQQWPLYYFPTDQDGVQWRRDFLGKALEIDVEDGFDLAQQWGTYSCWLSISDQIAVAPLFGDGADVSSIFSAADLQKWLTQFRRNVSSLLSAAESDQKLAQHAASQTANAVRSGWLSKAFGGQETEIAAFILDHLDELFHGLAASKGAQRIEGPDRTLLKVRKVEGIIEVLCSKFVGSGSSKMVFKVLRLAGADRLLTEDRRLYAYAKFPELKKIIRKIHLAQSMLEAEESIVSRGDKEKIEKIFPTYLASYKEQVERMSSEVEIARHVPEALVTWLVRSIKYPAMIKGMGAEYANMGTLNDVFCKRAPKACSREFISYAQMLCGLVAQMHERKILHLDLKLSNVFVLSNPSGEVRLKLGDFGVSRREIAGDMCTWRMSTLCSPGMAEIEKKPQPFSFAMDNWSLGMCVLNLVYGRWAVDRITDLSGRPTEPFRVVKYMIERVPQNNPRVTEIIEGLLDPNPASRWTAQRAAHALSEVLLGCNS